MNGKTSKILAAFSAGMILMLILIIGVPSRICRGEGQTDLKMLCLKLKASAKAWGLPAEKLDCQPLGCSATFSIDKPFESAGKVRFWTNTKRSEWLMWGDPNEPDDDFSINVAWKDTPGQYPGGIRNRLRNLKRLRRGKLVVANSYRTIEVHQGAFDVLAFAYKDQSLFKACTAFTNRQRNDHIIVQGWLCSNDTSVPPSKRLECILSSLSVPDQVSPDTTKDWCSDARTSPPA